ncbi:hypothetical protein [uncultured Draconibacterium sp.]|uniref:hypothetical protein n=1 Tax=uncultured Draconibacterium sp. TaxID=1573823 RepID=UPI0025DBFCCB|nr:hypothetical protein [uncultured Draconibacterium sp.]
MENQITTITIPSGHANHEITLDGPYMYVCTSKIDLRELIKLCEIQELKETGIALKESVFRTSQLMAAFINTGLEGVKECDIAPSTHDIWLIHELEKFLSSTEWIDQHPKVKE